MHHAKNRDSTPPGTFESHFSQPARSNNRLSSRAKMMMQGIGNANGNTASKTKKAELPWVEKYRPKKISDVSSQDEVTAALKSAIVSGQLPHLLFYGPPGTGKTSTILACCRELFGVEVMKSRVLELNASDDRGIKVVRTKIKAFAQTTVGRATYNGAQVPPFKIIILDEADTMTEVAQAALRRTIEDFSKVTRFCLICNYVSRIIEPLASRCAKFRFKPVPTEPLLERLQYVAEKENLRLGDKTLDTLFEVSGGDMRKAITFMQGAAQLVNPGGATSNPIEPSHVSQLSGKIPNDILKSFWEAVKSGKFDNVQRQVKNLCAEGYSAIAILECISKDVVEGDFIDDAKKAKILIKLAEADKCLADSADEELQLMDVAAQTLLFYKN